MTKSKDTYLVLYANTKSIVKPYPGPGDLDGDGVTKHQEHKNIAAQNGTPQRFADAASHPNRDGTEPPGERIGCYAPAGTQRQGGGPSDFLGDMLTIGLLVALFGLPRLGAEGAYPGAHIVRRIPTG